MTIRRQHRALLRTPQVERRSPPNAPVEVITMEFDNPWLAPGRFVKAHLHTHSTESDGNLSPHRVAEFHYRCGYSILSITDHDHVTDTSSFAQPDMVVIPGGEISCKTARGGFYHAVALGIGPDDLPPSGSDVREALGRIAEADGSAFIAHPYWSSNTVEDLTGLSHIIGIEVYNHGCEIEIGKGLSSVHWDDCLRRGDRYGALAVDDAHMYGYDALGGWTMLKVPELKASTALEALRRGHFYATMGPEIRDLRLAGNLIEVETSPVRAIRFMAQDQQGWCEESWGRPPLTGARWRVPNGTRYVRVELLDEQGRRAWGPPIFCGA